MEKFTQMLKKKIKDETAAFAILTAMVITFTITISTFEYIKFTKLSEVNANLNFSKTSEEIDGNSNTIITSKIDEKKAKKKNKEEFEKLKKENKLSEEIDRYYIKVNYGAQTITIYEKNSRGEYEPIKAMLCSTGIATPTSGVYRTLGKGNWWPLMGDVYGQYSTHIMGDILFHSVPYLTSGDKSSLEYWAYDQLGQRVSMGCVRLTVADARWIYYNCPVGTQVEFYSSSYPGPLGKPSTMQISDAPDDIRGWDPTDPDSRNPWPKYLEELEKKKEENKKPSKDNGKDKNDKNDKPSKDDNEEANKDDEENSGGNLGDKDDEEIVDTNIIETNIVDSNIIDSNIIDTNVIVNSIL